MDTYLEYLPLEIHIEITRYLPLKYALAYAGVSTLAHDAVYYGFNHKVELDFTSVLDDRSCNHSCIALPDAMILNNILHAHVRAETIHSFALPCTFTMFTELESYSSMYWSVFINHHGDEVGHPSGNIWYVEYNHFYGLQRCAPEANLIRMAKLVDKLEPYDEYLSRFNSTFFPETNVFSFSEPYSITLTPITSARVTFHMRVSLLMDFAYCRHDNSS